ncbi:hypothetical protein [Legionella sp. W05-934-2]|uniref:hypothetical protein n=1 Tax=Legionella sp. W05-934-2 TaxID=1198649 RepID=UPI0034623D35
MRIRLFDNDGIHTSDEIPDFDFDPTFLFELCKEVSIELGLWVVNALARDTDEPVIPFSIFQPSGDMQELTEDSDDSHGMMLY